MLWAGLWKTIVCNTSIKFSWCFTWSCRITPCATWFCFALISSLLPLWMIKLKKMAYSVFWKWITLFFLIFTGDHTNCSLKVSVQTLNFKFWTLLLLLAPWSWTRYIFILCWQWDLVIWVWIWKYPHIDSCFFSSVAGTIGEAWENAENIAWWQQYVIKERPLKVTYCAGGCTLVSKPLSSE